MAYLRSSLPISGSSESIFSTHKSRFLIVRVFCTFGHLLQKGVLALIMRRSSWPNLLSHHFTDILSLHCLQTNSFIKCILPTFSTIQHHGRFRPTRQNSYYIFLRSVTPQSRKMIRHVLRCFLYRYCPFFMCPNIWKKSWTHILL